MADRPQAIHRPAILPGVPPHTPPHTPAEPSEPQTVRSTLVYVKEPPLTWEYKTLVAQAAQLPDEAHLDALGAEGWELSAIVPAGDSVTYYFKRQKR